MPPNGQERLVRLTHLHCLGKQAEGQLSEAGLMSPGLPLLQDKAWGALPAGKGRSAEHRWCSLQCAAVLPSPDGLPAQAT